MKKPLPVLIIVLLILGIGGLIYYNSQPGKLDGFASCLKAKGVVFYGAFWCPHCQNQKKLFGKSFGKLNSIECSTPDGQGQLAVCKDKNITGYPIWEFSDGSREQGELTLEKLAEKTGCNLL